MSKSVINRIEKEANLLVGRALIALSVASVIGIPLAWVTVIPMSAFTVEAYILAAIDNLLRITVAAIIYKRKGEGKGLKWLATCYLLAFPMLFSAVIGRVVWILFVLPILHMARYYNTKNTMIAGILTGVAGVTCDVLSVLFSRKYPVMEFYYISFKEDTVLNVRKGADGLHAAVAANYDKINVRGLVLCVIFESLIFLAAVAFVTYLASHIAKQGKVIVDESLSEKMEHTLEEVELQTIIEAVSEDYECLINYDLESDDANYYRLSPKFSDLSKMWAEKRDWNSRMILFADRFVSNSDRIAFLTDISEENLTGKVSDNKTYSINSRLYFGGAGAWYQLNFMKNHAHEGHRCLLLWCRNIENEISMQQNQNEELEQALSKAEIASEAKTRFLFNMSHDLRTPMNAVMGFAAMAKKNIGNDARVTESIDKLEAAGGELLDIINDVLEISRIETGQVRINEKPYDIRNIETPLRSVFEPVIEQKNLTLVRTSSIKDNLIYMDDTRVNRILFNIIGNAVKFTPDGGKIDYSLKQLADMPDDRAVYEWTITDTGVGMREDFVEHIFERFAKEKTTTESGLEGTGLGMALVKELVDAMEGDVKVESKKGQGTTVTFRIPFKKCSEWEFNAVNRPRPWEKRYEGLRALLAEDNELNREIATDLLEERGMTVICVKNGKEALETVRTSKQGDFDVIFMDVQMPAMDGYDATRCIRALPNRYQANIPIIAMTANAFEEDKQEALAIGMNAHIAKPIDSNKLADVMAKCMNK